MIGLLCFVLAVLASPFKSKMRLEAENAVLRHQLIVLRRKLRGRVQLANNDRWFFVQLYHWFPSILQVLTIIRPETLRHRIAAKAERVLEPAQSKSPQQLSMVASSKAWRSPNAAKLIEAKSTPTVWKR
jgi:hypothetical protein